MAFLFFVTSKLQWNARTVTACYLAEQAEELGLDPVAVVHGRATRRPVVTAGIEPLLLVCGRVLVARASCQVGHAHHLTQQLLRRLQVLGAAQDGHRGRRRRDDTGEAAVVGGPAERPESQEQRAGAVRRRAIVLLTAAVVATAALLEPERRRRLAWPAGDGAAGSRLVGSSLWGALPVLLRHDH